MDDSCGLWRSRSLWKKYNPRYLLQLMFLPSYSGWFTGERDSINTCILMSMFDRVSEIHVFSENQTMKIIKIKKNLLIYCHAKMKRNDKINMFIHGLLHGTRLWHYYSELYTCIQVFSHFYFLFFYIWDSLSIIYH